MTLVLDRASDIRMLSHYKYITLACLVANAVLHLCSNTYL